MSLGQFRTPQGVNECSRGWSPPRRTEPPVHELRVPAPKGRTNFLSLASKEIHHQPRIKILATRMKMPFEVAENGTAIGGAAGVGKATTRSVVTSFMMILISDYFLSRFML